MGKILVISNDIDKGGPHGFREEHAAALRAAAGKNEVVVASVEEAPPHFSSAEVVAAFPLRVPPLSRLPSVRWIHSFSAGVDKILSPEVAASDVLLSNSSGIHATPIAEHILGFMLMFARQLHLARWRQHEHEWKKSQTSTELYGKTVLIVGLGEIGTETARLAKNFGTKILAVARSKKEKPDFVDELGTVDALDSMLPRADYVVITLPGTKDTHHLFDGKKFALMKKGAVVINIGRGSIIREADLIDALKRGTIAGAALDVFEKEPLSADSPLWDMPEVIITPHDSGLTDKYMDRAIERFCLNLRAYLAGETLPNEVDKKLGY